MPLRASLIALALIAAACTGPRRDAVVAPEYQQRLDGIEAVLDLRFAAAQDAPEGWERADELARLERLYVALTALRSRIALAEAAPSVDDAEEIEADLDRLTEAVTGG